MLETSDDWKYEGCPCDAKPILTGDSKLICKKCPGEIKQTVPKYASTNLNLMLLISVNKNHSWEIKNNYVFASGLRSTIRLKIQLTPAPLCSSIELVINCLERLP